MSDDDYANLALKSWGVREAILVVFACMVLASVFCTRLGLGGWQIGRFA